MKKDKRKSTYNIKQVTAAMNKLRDELNSKCERYVDRSLIKTLDDNSKIK